MTHGFHEYPAGMQAAAADRCLDVLPGDSLLDPFCGSGTSITVGMTKGYCGFGVDVSPLATFVASHRGWRPVWGEQTLKLLRATAKASINNMEDAAKLLMEETERASKVETAGGDAKTNGTRGASPTGAVPRDWRPIQKALALELESGKLMSALKSQGKEPGVPGALWFCLSVALQRSQKGRGKKRPYKKQRKKAAINAEASDSILTPQQVSCGDAFDTCVDEYCDRIGELLIRVPGDVPQPVYFNKDVRRVTLPTQIDAVLTSPPYPGVYDYLSFARKVRAGSGTATKLTAGAGALRDEADGVNATKETANETAKEIVPGSEGYFKTAVPADRTWPKEWTSLEIGSRKALRSDPYAFKEQWQKEQEGWLGMVARSLKPGGRAAVMVGDGANINTQKSILEAGEVCGLKGIAAVTMALSHSMEDGRVWNAARKEHLVLLEKPVGGGGVRPL